MFPLRIGLALLAGLLGCLAVDARETAKTPLDFELTDGREFVVLSQLPPRLTMVNFWRADCPPCVREMPLLAAAARTGALRVVAVALQRPAETLAAPASVSQSLSPPLLSLHGPAEPRGLLARFGNPHGVLPHTVLLDRQRRPCATHSGEIDAAWLEAALSRCADVAGQK